jgi:hypothetical protein
VSCEKTELNEQIYKDLSGGDIYTPDISKYKKRYQYKLTGESGEDDYRLFFLDDEVWLAIVYKSNNVIWCINKIKKLSDEPLSTFEWEKYKQQEKDNQEYDGEGYLMGGWFGGWGVTSMALCDMNGDGLKELYFTFSYGTPWDSIYIH